MTFQFLINLKWFSQEKMGIRYIIHKSLCFNTLNIIIGCMCTWNLMHWIDKDQVSIMFIIVLTLMHLESMHTLTQLKFPVKTFKSMISFKNCLKSIMHFIKEKIGQWDWKLINLWFRNHVFQMYFFVFVGNAKVKKSFRKCQLVFWKQKMNAQWY